MCHFKTDIGAAGTNVPIREKAHSGVSPAGAAKNAAQGISLRLSNCSIGAEAPAAAIGKTASADFASARYKYQKQNA